MEALFKYNFLLPCPQAETCYNKSGLTLILVILVGSIIFFVYIV